MKKIKHLFLLFCFSSFVTSCDVSYLDKEIEDISWDGEVKIPAGFINYSLSEIFSDIGSSDLGPTDTEEFSFTYTETFSGESNSTFEVEIDDTTISNSIESPITQDNLNAIGETFPYTITAEIAPGVANPLIGTRSRDNRTVKDLGLSQDLTGVSFNGGTMDFTFKSTIDSNIEIVVTTPSFTKKSDGSIYTETLNIVGETEKTLSLSLDEYNADFTNDGTGTGKTKNTIVVDVNAAFTFAAGNQLDANDAISYEAILSSASYEVIYGDFKQEAFSVSSNNIDLGDFFDNFNEGDVSFENVKMEIKVTNDYGFPISMNLGSVKGVNANSSVNLTYTGNGSLTNTIIVDGVDNFGDNEVVTSAILDGNNSNIGALLESKPTSIDFSISGSANPLSNGSPNTNFYAASNNGLKAEISLGFDKISLSKVIEFDGGEDLENFRSVKLIANVENKIPLTGDVVLEFRNNLTNVVHRESLTAFKAANIDQSNQSDGVAVASSFEIELSDEEINNITNASEINIIISLQLPKGADSVVIKGSDSVDVSIGLEAKTNITSEN